MKVRQVIYLVLGIICVIIQVRVYQVVSLANPAVTPKERGESGFLVGFYLAENFFLIPTILCAIGVYRVWRKIKKKEREEQELFLSFDEPSKP